MEWMGIDSYLLYSDIRSRATVLCLPPGMPSAVQSNAFQSASQGPTFQPKKRSVPEKIRERFGEKDDGQHRTDADPKPKTKRAATMDRLASQSTQITKDDLNQLFDTIL